MEFAAKPMKKKSSRWNRIRFWFKPSYVAWRSKQIAIYHFINLNKVIPGNLRQYSPRRVRKEVFPNLPLPKNAPSICIVTPSLNQGAYIRATVESILQNYVPNLDYLIMDGVSQDNTCQILEELTQNYHGTFRWQSAPDQGQPDAINRGFAQVNGDLMAWINSDDLLMPGALRFITTFFAAHPEVDVIYGHRLLINAQGQEIGRWVVPAYYRGCLKYFDFVPQETLFWRRRIWEKAGGRLDENYRFALDWELLQRFERTGAKFVRVPYFLGCFRVHEEQKTSSQINEIGKREMESLRPKFNNEMEFRALMRDAVQSELIRARFCDWLLSCGIRSTRI